MEDHARAELWAPFSVSATVVLPAGLRRHEVIRGDVMGAVDRLHRVGYIAVIVRLAIALAIYVASTARHPARRL